MYALVAVFLIPVFASGSEIIFDRPAAEFIKETPAAIVLNEYNIRRKPQFHFRNPGKVSRCTLENSPCDPNLPIVLELPKANHESKIFHLHFLTDGNPKDVAIRVLPEDFIPYSVYGRSKLGK